MGKLELKKYMLSISDKTDYTGGVEEDVIQEFENQINTKLPECYRWYLSEYGSGGIGGVDVLGIGIDNYNTCIEYIEDFKSHGLPDHFIPLIDCDEYLYCMDLSRVKDGDCNIVMWDSLGHTNDVSDSFYNFLIEQFKLLL